MPKSILVVMMMVRRYCNLRREKMKKYTKKQLERMTSYYDILKLASEAINKNLGQMADLQGTINLNINPIALEDVQEVLDNCFDGTMEAFIQTTSYGIPELRITYNR